MMNIEWALLYLVLGSFVGFMGGLLGVGGGGILVPLLTSIFVWQGVASDSVVHSALGTSLACMVVSSSSSVRAHTSRGTIVWSMAGGMAPGILLGAFLTSRIAVRINSIYIAVFFALFMLLMAFQMLSNWKPKVSDTPTSIGGLFIIGTLIGSVSSLAAVGGGFLTVMYLTYKSIDMKRAVGTSSAIGLPISLAGTLGYMISGWSKTASEPYTLGFVYVPAFIIIAAASAAAAPYGVRCSVNLPDIQLRRMFAALSLVLSIKMVFAVMLN